MAYEYIGFKNLEHLPGHFAISTSVIESIASIAVKEIENVELIDKTTLKNPVVVKVVENDLYLQISLRIRYSSNINDVCLNVQNKISQALLQMTAIRCKEIDIKIVGFII